MFDMEKNRLPIGIENFEEMCMEDYCYVDKTAMIKDFLRRRGKVNLFTHPHRFGKTLNMAMLKTFFEIYIFAKSLENLFLICYYKKGKTIEAATLNVAQLTR